MKVGIVTYSLMIGGVERVILNLYKGLEKEGYEPTVIEINKKGLWSDKFRSMGIKVEQVLPHSWRSKKNHAFRILDHLKEYDLLFLNDVQYVHSILGFLPATTRVFPIVHGNLDSMLRNASFNRSQIEGVVCVNPLLSERLINEYGVEKEMIHVIPNCLDISNITSYASQDRKGQFVYLGRLTDFEKGVLDIPDIFKIVSEHAPDVQVDIYGAGPDRELLLQKINENNLEQVIHLKGEIDPDDVYQVLSNYVYLVFPSKFESGALVMKEGMVCGLIPLAYRLPGQIDIILNHGENGFMASPGNIEEFAANVLEIYNDQERIFQMRNEAVQTIVDKFSIDAMMKHYLKIITDTKNKLPSERSNRMEIEILEEFPLVPLFLLRPVRKALRTLGLYK